MKKWSKLTNKYHSDPTDNNQKTLDIQAKELFLFNISNLFHVDDEQICYNIYESMLKKANIKNKC